MPMDPGTSVLLHFTDIETCCPYIIEVEERMSTNRYDQMIIKIRYCQEHYLHDQQEIDNDKNTKRKKITNVYTLQRSVRIHQINKKNIQDNNNIQKSPERNICIKDRMYIK